jgi:phospholipase/carboxylesterase
MSEPFELSVRGRFFRIQPPELEPARAVLLAVHGFTGDELSMEIFTRKLRRFFWVIYPRAPHVLPQGGYSWVETALSFHQPVSDFLPAVQELNFCVDLLFTDLEISRLPLFSLGFSQGAALGLVYSSLFSQPGQRQAFLAGFLPADMEVQPASLTRRQYFVAHGSRDSVVPIEQSRRILKFLQDSGAETQYCESNSAHKLGLECIKQLENFYLNDPAVITGPG